MIGAKLGIWIIDKELGRGGMGQVYLAHRAPAEVPGDGAVPNEAAVKVLAPELAQDAGFLHRFQREIEALSQLDHPNIVRFYESGVQDGRYFYAMEFIPGKNFDELLNDRGRLPWQEVLDVALQVCPALKHAHDHGIIHRDLKPQNLLQTEAGLVKLADFGVAKVFAGRQLTAAGSLVGTAEYTSPEQAAGKPVTVRSDLYSLGVVLYTLLIGRTPFQGTGVLDLLHKHRFAQFDPPQRIVLDIPSELDEIVCALLAKDPGERPANAMVLHRRLEVLRNKLARKEQLTIVSAQEEATRAENLEMGPDSPGPATLMSRLVREELQRQQRSGPLGRFFNHPLVLVTLFVLCVGLIVWRFWPLSADTLYQRGAALMRKDDGFDWEQAEAKYFKELDAKYPDHPYQEPLKEFRRRIDERKAESRARKNPSPALVSSEASSEAQRFYLRGQRLRQEGDLLGAQRVWQNAVLAFKGVESEKKWADLAEKGLLELGQGLPTDEKRWAVIQEALDRARGLDKGEAGKVRQAIEDLYRDDPAILQRVRDYFPR